MSSRPGNRFTGTIGPVQSPSDGPIQWWVEASDSGGGQSRTDASVMQVTANC